MTQPQTDRPEVLASYVVATLAYWSPADREKFIGLLERQLGLCAAERARCAQQARLAADAYPCASRRSACLHVAERIEALRDEV